MFQLPSYEVHLVIGVVVPSCQTIPLAWLRSAHVLFCPMGESSEEPEPSVPNKLVLKVANLTTYQETKCSQSILKPDQLPPTQNLARALASPAPHSDISSKLAPPTLPLHILSSPPITVSAFKAVAAENPRPIAPAAGIANLNQATASAVRTRLSCRPVAHAIGTFAESCATATATVVC